jgi:uncharacterized protein YndB with AHSA1/START domain
MSLSATVFRGRVIAAFQEEPVRSVELSRTISAPRSAVWAVLADFPNIAEWNSGVKASFSTSDAASGVGAQRHCDLSPAGGLEETIAEWEPNERLVVNIDSASKVPLKSARATFALDEAAPSSTTAKLHYEYEAKFGSIGKLLGPLLDRQFTKGFTGFLEDLDAASTTANS